MKNVITFINMFKQLMAVLNNKQKRQAIIVAFMAIFSALLETMGVSVVIPFILAMLQPEQLIENKYIGPLLELSGVTNTIGIVTVTAVLIIAVYVIKNSFILLK